MTTVTGKWNSVTNNSQYSSTGSGNTTPPAIPRTPTLDAAGAADSAVYFLRLVSHSGSVVTIATNTLFPITGFNQTISQSGTLGGTAAASVSLSPISLTLSSAAAIEQLVATMDPGSPYSEVDIIGYRASDGALLSELSLGTALPTAITLDASGGAAVAITYGAFEYQHNTLNAAGTLVAAPAVAWSSITNSATFNAGGTAFAPATTQPSSGIATATPSLTPYVQLITASGSILTVNGANLFRLSDLSAPSTQAFNPGGIGGAGAGTVKFKPASLAFADPSLTTPLLSALSLNTALAAVNIYSLPAGADPTTTAATAILNLGDVQVTTLSLDQTGQASVSFSYGSQAVQTRVASNTTLTAKWDGITNSSGYGTSSTTSSVTPPTSPSSPKLSTGNTADAATYYLRLISTAGTTVSAGGATYFAISGYNAAFTQGSSLEASTSSVTLSPLTLTLTSPAAIPALAKSLDSGATFGEADIIGYRSTDGALLTELSLGDVLPTSLSVDGSGSADIALSYAAFELQHNTLNANGTLVAAPAVAWDSVHSTATFTGTPATAPTIQPTASITSPVTLTPYAQIVTASGSILTVNGKNLFQLSGLVAGSTQTVNFSTGAGRAAFAPAALTFADPALATPLLADLLGGTALAEVNIFSYPTTATLGVSIPEETLNLGNVLVTDVTLAAGGQASVALTASSQAQQQKIGNNASVTTSWNTLTSVSSFGTSASGSATPPLSPSSASLDATATAEAASYYLRLINTAGTATTVAGASLFPLLSTSITATVAAAGTVSGSPTLAPATLSLAAAAAIPGLLQNLAAGQPYGEADIIGYRTSDGALLSDLSLGFALPTSLTVDASGTADLALTYNALEFQHNTLNAAGTLVAAPPVAYNSISNSATFSTGGTFAATPAAAPTLSANLVAPSSTSLVAYAQIIVSGASLLAVNNTNLFRLSDVSAAATQTFVPAGNGAAKASFAPASLTFADASLATPLLASLTAGTTLAEIDIFSFAAGDNPINAKPVQTLNLGYAEVTASTIDPAGTPTIGLTYGSQAEQYYTAACYLPGTRIRTDHGKVPIEQLRETDRVLTASGRLRPIVWIGHRAYDGRFIRGNRRILPITIRAGALADGIPARDLTLSPLHALYLEGVLIDAQDLVNGTTIVQAEAVDSVTYFNLELDTHDVVFAEGAAAETFVGDISRALFQNAADYARAYPGAPWQDTTYCAPRLDHGPAFHRARARIAHRAGLEPDRIAPTGPLAGSIDRIAGAFVEGWAQNPATPEARVLLEILHEGEVIGTTIANRLRPDLAEAGLGSGRHAFQFTAPPGTHLAPDTLAIRRAQDGTQLPRLTAA
jgi:type VI protein secretion system component Hcp